MDEMTEPIPGDDSLGGLAPLQTSYLPLFNRGMINPLTVVQQKVTNCPLPALLAALAYAMPDRLPRMIHWLPLATPRRSWFFDRDRPKQVHSEPTAFTIREILRVTFPNASAIDISPILFMDHMTPKEVIEAGGTRPRFAFSTDRGGWVSYIEKAYVVRRCNNQYINLDFLGRSAIPLTVARVVEDVAGDFDWFRLANRGWEMLPDAEPASPDPPPGREDREMFGSSVEAIRTFRSNKGVIKRLGEIFAAHKKRATIATTHNHTLAIVGYDAKSNKVKLYDALGRGPRGLGVPREMKLDAFLAQHDAVYQVR
jgi:hypothetical protein